MAPTWAVRGLLTIHVLYGMFMNYTKNSEIQKHQRKTRVSSKFSQRMYLSDIEANDDSEEAELYHVF